MISGLIIGLLVGVVAGIVVGLLVRSGHVVRTRTAEARLADALAANRRLTEGPATLQQLTGTAQAEMARMSAQLEHERMINQERAMGFEQTRQQLTGEFALGCPVRPFDGTTSIPAVGRHRAQRNPAAGRG